MGHHLARLREKPLAQKSLIHLPVQWLFLGRAEKPQKLSCPISTNQFTLNKSPAVLNNIYNLFCWAPTIICNAMQIQPIKNVASHPCLVQHVSAPERILSMPVM
jgi:hypothetical protein